MVDILLNFYKSNALTINIILLTFIIIATIIILIYKEAIKKIYNKNKEVINYIIVGALTTLVSVGSYYLFRFIISDYVILSIISWILAVTFAYIANRLFVFESKDEHILEEIIKFVTCRLTTLGMELLLMILFVSILKMNDMVAKIILQVVILVLNYIFSKLFVFKGGRK